MSAGDYVKMLDARYGSLAAQVEEDVAESRSLTPEQDDLMVSAASRAAMQILLARPDWASALAFEEPPAADYESIRRRLMARRKV